MAYAKFVAYGLFSQNSDYEPPKPPIDFNAYAMTTPTRQVFGEVLATQASDYTLDLATFGTILLMVVQNLDTTNYFTATWRSAANGSTDNKARVTTNYGFLVTNDVTPGSDLILRANTADCKAYIWVVGLV